MREVMGFFQADSEGASLIGVVELDMSLYPSWVAIDTALEAALKAADVYFGNEAYLLYADAATMEADEAESERQFYAEEPRDLEVRPRLVLDVEDETAMFRKLLTFLVKEGEGTIDEAGVEAAVAHYHSLAHANADRDAANAKMKTGAAVHTSCECGIAYPDPRSIPFNPSTMDARNVLKDSAVDYKAGKTLVTAVHPLPKHLAKRNGKFWGALDSDPKISFMGQSAAAIQRKAAIHDAWVAKFGPHNA